MLPRLTILRLRQRSLARGVLLSLGACAVSLRLAGFPDAGNLHPSRWLLPAAPVVLWGMWETARCIPRRSGLYHAGVLILLYSELMMLALVLLLCIFL